MPRQVIIDGNNLLHATHAHAPVSHIGRETLVRIVERWAERVDAEVTLVFDGSVPQRGLAKQMASPHLSVSFSAPVTADDVIVDMIHKAGDPGALRIVTSDKAIRHEAGLRRCGTTEAASFVRELFYPVDEPRPANSRGKEPKTSEKPDKLSKEELRDWLEVFGLDNSERSDGHDTSGR